MWAEAPACEETENADVGVVYFTHPARSPTPRTRRVAMQPTVGGGFSKTQRALNGSGVFCWLAGAGRPLCAHDAGSVPPPPPPSPINHHIPIPPQTWRTSFSTASRGRAALQLGARWCSLRSSFASRWAPRNKCPAPLE